MSGPPSQNLVSNVEESEQDDVIDPVIDTMQVLPPNPELTAPLVFTFCVDMAQKIHGYELIKLRYGFASQRQMIDYVIAHPGIHMRIKEMRSIWFSDSNLESRLRKLAGHAVLGALPLTADMMFNPRVPESQRIDALKAHARIAGVDGLPAATKEAIAAGQSGGAGKFSINIIFPNAGRTETIATIDHDPDEDE